MEHSRSVVLKRTTSISATLTESEIERALVREVLIKVAPELMPHVDGLDAIRPKLQISVILSSRSGDANVTVSYEEEVEVAP